MNGPLWGLWARRCAGRRQCAIFKRESYWGAELKLSGKDEFYSRARYDLRVGLSAGFTRNTFSPEEKSTIGVEFATRVVSIKDERNPAQNARIKAQVPFRRSHVFFLNMNRKWLGMVFCDKRCCSSTSIFPNAPSTKFLHDGIRAEKY